MQKLQSPSLASFAFLYWANEVTITHRSTLLLHLWFGLLAIANEMGTGNQEKRLCSRYSSSVYQNLNPVLLFRDGKSVPLTIAVIWLYKKHLINRLHLSSTNFHFSLNINFISDYSWSKRDHRAAFFSENEKKISLKSLLTTKSFQLNTFFPIDIRFDYVPLIRII